MTQPAGYNLVWSDDFNTPLDPNKWEIATTANYPWLDCDTSDNAWSENGNLVIRTKKGTCPGGQTKCTGFNTGLVRSKIAWKYGYFEARSKMAPGKGLNNAFWTVGENWTWPPEIDIYESEGYVAVPNTLWNAYHYGSSSNPQEIGKNHVSNIDYSSDYHIFGVEWTPTMIRWFIDDQETFNIDSTKYPITSIPMNLILNIDPGWEICPNPPDLPKYHYIDYVRVYQKGAPVGKMFSILDFISDATNIKRGVSAFLNPSGKFTKDQACLEISRILTTIPGTKFFVFNVLDDNKNIIAVTVMNNEVNGKFDKPGASSETCTRLGNL